MDNEGRLHPHVSEATDPNTASRRLAELAHERGLQSIVASNPSTPPATLKQLGRAKDPLIRRAVTQNPNTPLPLLLDLAQQFPREFLDNPVIPLLTLTQPNFMKAAPRETWKRLLLFEDLPSYWLQLLTQENIVGIRYGDEIKVTAKSHVALAGEATGAWRHQALGALGEYHHYRSYTQINIHLFALFSLAFPDEVTKLDWSNDYLRRHISKDPQILALPDQELSEIVLSFFARSQDDTLQGKAARHRRTPPGRLTTLARHENPAIRRGVASNPRVPHTLLQQLASDSDDSVRRAAAFHPHLTPDELEIIALDSAAPVRAAIASRPQLNAATFAFLAADTEVLVRAALACNAHASLEVLTVLAHDTEIEVQAAAASNPRISRALMTELQKQSSKVIHAALAGNAQTPPHILAQIATDLYPHSTMYRRLAANPRTPLSLLETLLQHNDRHVWAAIARNPNATPALLTRLAQVSDDDVRSAVAGNKHTPIAVVRELAHQSQRAVWYALAANPHTPLDIIERIIATDDMELWRRVASHPTLMRAHRRPFRDLFIKELQKHLETSSLPRNFYEILLRLARRSSTLQGALLEALVPTASVNSSHWPERYRTALQEQASDTELAALTHDGNRFVRAAARTTLAKRRPKRTGSRKEPHA
ncbi:hypothetical protein [Ktedonospora formicarum]|uniref:Leucine rich repeat variant domain-containing protein n=1 Tax=Ktedonospora formicarum TaxID=2778364 RepID=A0A8J3I7K3_9CHLR|nr:hypothetical protein [Ktedonospora formicarum]GHO47268.1 hypothetical protein KSX_54310 [Ktedonospora formicarum]